MSSLQIGYHTGSGGNPTGIGDHMRRLAGARRPRVLAMADVTTGFFDAINDFMPDDIFVYRVVKDRHEGWAVPDYKKSPEAAAIEYVDKILGEIPPEFNEHKDKIYIAFGNELAHEHDKFVWDWSYYCGKLIMERGWRAVGPNWASGTPGEDSYSSPEALKFYKLCIDSEGRCAVGQHLYSYENNLFANEQGLVARYRYIYAASEAAHGDRPLVIAKEFGTRQDQLGNGPHDWVNQLRKLNERYPDFPPACTWYLGTWHTKQIANETQATIKPVTDYLVSLGAWEKRTFTPTSKPDKKTDDPKQLVEVPPKPKPAPKAPVSFAHFELGNKVGAHDNIFRVNIPTWFRFILTNNSSQPVEVGGIGVMIYHWNAGQSKWVPHQYQHSYDKIKNKALQPGESLDHEDHFVPTEVGIMAVQPIWTADQEAPNKRAANQMESIRDPQREYPPIYVKIGAHFEVGKVLSENEVTKLPWHAEAVEQKLDQEQKNEAGLKDQTGSKGSNEDLAQNEPKGGHNPINVSPPNIDIKSGASGPAASGIAAHLKSLIFQLAALGVYSSQISPMALASAGIQPLSQELRIDYGGESYLVQLAYQASGPDWLAYYRLASDPTTVFIVSTGGGGSVPRQDAKAVDPKPEVPAETGDQAPPETTAPEAVVVADEQVVDDTKDTVIVEQALPKTPDAIKLKQKKHQEGFVLEVPFRNQNGPGATKFGGDCGPTCASMIIEAVTGTRVDPDDLMKRLGKTSTNPLENYTNTIHLTKVLNWYEIEVEYKKDATSGYIEDKLKEGLPIISLVHYGSLPARSKALKSFNGWHFVLLVGCDDNEFYFQDPLNNDGKISQVTKSTFMTATAAQSGVVNSHQILIARTKGLYPAQEWEKDLPADIAFVPAIAERAEAMKTPEGDLITAWVYTYPKTPVLIRKGNLVEVKKNRMNIRSAPTADATKVENGKTTTYDTKLGQAFPGTTMVLTGKYENGYAQVKLMLEKSNPTKVVIRPVIIGKSFDLREYFMGTRSNVQWEIWSTRGQESLELQKQGTDDFRLVKNVNAEQMHMVTQGGRNYVARTYDSSMSDTKYYTLQDENKPYSLWCPLDMKLGEMYLRNPFVRVYEKSGAMKEDAKKASTHLKLVEHYKEFGGYDWAIKWGWPKDQLNRIGNDIKLKDCLLIEWVEGGEQYVLSKELGYFVAWARTHNDPNSPPFSVISEVNTGRSALQPNGISLPGHISAFLQQRGIG